jgi:hypothetical protein
LVPFYLGQCVRHVALHTRVSHLASACRGGPASVTPPACLLHALLHVNHITLQSRRPDALQERAAVAM